MVPIQNIHYVHTGCRSLNRYVETDLLDGNDSYFVIHFIGTDKTTTVIENPFPPLA